MDSLSHYDFFLPEDLIATRPLPNRASSRLLVLRASDQNAVHDHFAHLHNYLVDGDVLVLNNTKVMRARIEAFKKTGGRVEILLVRPLPGGQWAALINGKGPFLPGTQFILGNADLEHTIIVERKDASEPGLYEVSSTIDLHNYLTSFGELPLPPYFRRRAEPEDYVRYQTVYAKYLGAVAAPTAGLHLTDDYLQHLQSRGIRVVEITLHVGPGTFLPIRTESIADHKMHTEFFSLSESAAHVLNDARARKARIIPVGTTSMRVLEQVMAWAHEQDRDEFFAIDGSTSIFIRPGHKFLAAQALITNFHLPRSTLLLLISAFAGRDRIFAAYHEAIKERYRFFSYGDASFLEIHQ